jgi:hypothetical protein
MLYGCKFVRPWQNIRVLLPLQFLYQVKNVGRDCFGLLSVGNRKI